MSRSLKKGPYVDANVLRKVQTATDRRAPIKTWARASSITPEVVGYVFELRNGRDFLRVQVVEDMVGHKLGEFAPTRTFRRHGGKQQTEETPAAAPTPK